MMNPFQLAEVMNPLEQAKVTNLLQLAEAMNPLDQTEVTNLQVDRLVMQKIGSWKSRVMLRRLRTGESPTSAITKMKETVFFWTMRRGETKRLINAGMTFTKS
jgi:hypothetical protein